MMQFYNSLKAVEVQETFDFFDGDNDCRSNQVGLKLIDQKDSLYPNQ